MNSCGTGERPSDKTYHSFVIDLNSQTRYLAMDFTEVPAMKKKSAPARQPSIYDVVKHSGVSIVTVSRAFNDYPHVSQRMRDRVLQAAREVGYKPRVVSKRRVIAVIIGHLDILRAGDYKTRLISHIVQAASKEGFLVEFIPYDAIDLATQHHVDGIIEVGLTGSEIDKLKDLPRVPTLLTNNQSPRKSWAAICSDHYQESRMATEHLIERGHRRIALILDELEGWGPGQRQQGFRDVMTGDKAFHPVVLSAEENTPLDMAQKMLEEGCSAGILLSDNAGLAIYDALVNELELHIPEDFSMIGIENDAVSRFLHPRQTTIEQPLAKLAEACVGYIAGKALYRRQVKAPSPIPSRLIVRNSVKTIS
ncbi:MAG TPA: hypothetical protein DCZ95_04855 [Verrucomicrobia bacterium]|nr:MAG: hypothetical protein A2X46_08405 [Lentisphaerae bacterium GWF2_57_35]HBA83406.1 hypothetical protein [Verrucomicrobiota bacterium]